MKVIKNISYTGKVECVNYDRNGAHIRLYDVTRVNLLTSEGQPIKKAAFDFNYWSGYDYCAKLAQQIRALDTDDVVTVYVKTCEYPFRRNETSLEIENESLKDYEMVSLDVS